MENIDIKNHVQGKSIYVDDIPIIEGTLYGVIKSSSIAHGDITHINIKEALAVEGVKYILDSTDIPGENQIGGIIQDEELLSSKEIHFYGQPILLILADSEEIAFKARKLIQIDYLEKEVIVDPRKAFEKGHIIGSPRHFKTGSTDDNWDKCVHIFEERIDSNGQEHLYLETQGSYAIPKENGHIKIISSTQGPTAGQKIVARILNKAMHQIEFDVTRLGGGFGGKEDQATPYAALAALGTYISKNPVKVILDRIDDLKMTGKRHPYSTDIKIGLDAQYKIINFEAQYYQNAGAAADLSPAILERTLFHSTNAYYIPNVTISAYSCKTNLPPNTAFRGFGGPQAMYVIESAIAKAAHALNVEPHIIQYGNLLSEKDTFPYGQIATQVNSKTSWDQLTNIVDIKEHNNKIDIFNKENKYHKKGAAFMPICFGISFTNTPMNQARALVHVYQDGSVAISTGAVEMGQGVNTKMIQVAAKTLGIPTDKVKIETTNTTRVANTSPTAASATADLNGKALAIACNEILERFKVYYAKKHNVLTESINIRNKKITINNDIVIKWNDAITEVFLERISLSAIGHYATPVIHFDKSIEKGHPFAYHVYGTALTTVTLDIIRGRYTIDDVTIVHDFGNSMNYEIDKGQVEGGLVQGIGWMTMEEISYNDKGRLLSGSLSTYKIPDIYSVPKTINITPLKTEGHDLAILKSKAVGEPPLMYGIGTYFAIRNAILAHRNNKELKFDAPYTVEKVLMDLIQ